MLFFVEDAAVKIQAVFRGHKVRATMKQGDSSAASATNNAATKDADKVPSTTKNGETIDEPTKEELEAEFREDDKGNEIIINFMCACVCM